MPSTPAPTGVPPRKRRGMTLIELMIAIVVVGILAAIAFPSFMDSIRKSRRSEALNALAQLQQAQERWRGGHAAYTTTLSDLAVASPTPSGYYTLSLAAPSSPSTTANGYIAIAEGASGTSQANDPQCRKLAVQVAGGSVTYAGCTGCGTLTFANTHPCWAR